MAAAGCHINDLVLVILQLATKFNKIMYIDFDYNHGDAVEQASTQRTVS